MHPLLTSLRPQQWIKNLLVAAAPAAAGVLDQGGALGRTLVGVVTFSMVASAVYLINDLADVQVDRQHPEKKYRPIAAGQVTEQNARNVAVGLIVVGLALGAVASGWFAMILVVYLLVNIAYSLGMKRVPYVELLAVASGFFLRAIAGGGLTDVPLSGWFLVVISAGSLFVVSGKRSVEFQRVNAGAAGRAVLSNYTSGSLVMVRAAAGVAAVVGYALWAITETTAASPWDLLSLVPFAAALYRYDMAIQEGRGEDPQHVLVHDRIFQLLLLAWLLIYGIGVYV